MRDVYDLKRKGLKLGLIDLVQGKVKTLYLWNYNKDIEDLLDLPEEENKAGLKALAKRIIKECGDR